MALHKSSESVCIPPFRWKPEAEHTCVCENRKSAEMVECERLPPIYSAYDLHFYIPEEEIVLCLSLV
ncbi:hypothetical protein LIBO111022_05530 [Listeria booriae]|nr:Uncharacterised protein [Listeria booriae]